MINKYEKAKNLYEKKTDWAAIFTVVLLVGLGILVIAAQ